jgi:hypothetical protein
MVRGVGWVDREEKLKQHCYTFTMPCHMHGHAKELAFFMFLPCLSNTHMPSFVFVHGLAIPIDGVRTRQGPALTTLTVIRAYSCPI